jgi:NAD(P)-dependent dehydrogenase (short-subunit alcohol dehydrogenase family)
LKGLLDGKVAIVTGASRGIGAASARVFSEAGASVVLAARSEQQIAQLAREIETAGGKALAVATDVGDPGSVDGLIKRALDEYGRVDIAFNNAGDGHMPAPLADVAVEDFDRAVRVNLRGVFLCLKYEIPAMVRNGGGAIVNMSSTAGIQGVAGIAGYVASKHGIVGLTKTAALDYASQNIRVNVITPGPILTERLKQVKDPTPIISAVPMGRIGQPVEVGYLVAWLCSDFASYITGAIIPIDGGRSSGSFWRKE